MNITKEKRFRKFIRKKKIARNLAASQIIAAIANITCSSLLIALMIATACLS